MKLVLVSLAVAVAATAAAETAPRFTRERAVIPAAAGPNRLPADVPLLTGARPVRHAGAKVVGGLEDLRLFDANGREVGWLRIDPAPPEERWASGSILPVPATEDASGFEVDLGETRRIDRLRLDGLAAPYLKRFRLEGSGDRERWAVLVEDATLFDLPDENLRRPHVELAPGEYRYLRLVWDDRSSAVLAPPAGVAVRLADTAPSAPPVVVALPFERRPSEPQTSRFRVHLPGVGLPVVALELEVGGGHVLRTVRVTEPRLRGEELGPVSLGAGPIRRAVRGDLVAGELRVPVSRPNGADLDLAVDDGDNPPLDLTGVRAVLAPLPWIYFESASGETLVARYGDPKLGAARYDLEAARAAVAEASAATATWGDVRALEPPPAAPKEEAPPPITGASIDLAPFRFARAIPDGPPGLVAAVVDAAVLAHSADLRDLRIADAAARQVPYLVERLDEPLEIELAPLEPIPAAKPDARTSRHRLRLPYANLPEARLVLATKANIFERTVGVAVERPPVDARAEQRSEIVASGTWRHADPSRPAPVFVLTLPRLGVVEAELRIDEGDNAPIPLDPPKLLLPARRVRFFRAETTPLTIHYGHPKLEAPRYDLELLASRVLRATAVEVMLGPERTASAADDGDGTVAGPRRDAWIFWGVLLAAVVALLVVIARLLSGDAAAKPSA